MVWQEEGRVKSEGERLTRRVKSEGLDALVSEIETGGFMESEKGMGRVRGSMRFQSEFWFPKSQSEVSGKNNWEEEWYGGIENA